MRKQCSGFSSPQRAREAKVLQKGTKTLPEALKEAQRLLWKRQLKAPGIETTGLAEGPENMEDGEDQERKEGHQDLPLDWSLQGRTIT